MNSEIYDQDTNAPPYTIEIFEDIGRAFCIALLDQADKNPVSRIHASGTFKTLEGIKVDVTSQHKILIPFKRALIKSSQSFQKNLQPLNILKKPSSSQPRSHPLNKENEPKKLVSKEINIINEKTEDSTESLLRP